MKKKLTLDVEALAVESFDTHTPTPGVGTVKGRDLNVEEAAITVPVTPNCTWTGGCSTCVMSACTCATQCGQTCPLTGCNTCATCTLCPSFGDPVCCA